MTILSKNDECRKKTDLKANARGFLALFDTCHFPRPLLTKYLLYFRECSKGLTSWQVKEGVVVGITTNGGSLNTITCLLVFVSKWSILTTAPFVDRFKSIYFHVFYYIVWSWSWNAHFIWSYLQRANKGNAFRSGIFASLPTDSWHVEVLEPSAGKSCS